MEQTLADEFNDKVTEAGYWSPPGIKGPPAMKTGVVGEQLFEKLQDVRPAIFANVQDTGEVMMGDVSEEGFNLFLYGRSMPQRPKLLFTRIGCMKKAAVYANVGKVARAFSKSDVDPEDDDASSEEPD